MPKVKVWNDNDYPHTETFKGEKITIAPHEHIEMEWEEAVEFRGQFTGIAPLAENGEPDPRFFKMIRVEQVKPEEVFRDTPLVNHADGKVAATPEQLAAMIAQFAHLRVRDPEAEKASPAQTSELADLKAQVEELRALLITQGEKKAGRPKKEAVA